MCENKPLSFINKYRPFGDEGEEYEAVEVKNGGCWCLAAPVDWWTAAWLGACVYDPHGRLSDELLAKGHLAAVILLLQNNV